MSKCIKRIDVTPNDESGFDITEETPAKTTAPKSCRQRCTGYDNTQSISSESLVGKCLVHIGEASRDIYENAVIYIVESTPEKVQGIMINKLLFGTAAIECKNAGEDGKPEARNVYEDLYQGGPENPAHGFVLFPTKERRCNDSYAKIQGDISVSTSFGILQEILDGVGPSRKIIAMGHCLWRRGELEWEIFNNQWLIVPGNPELVFDTKLEDRWQKAMQESGVNLMTYLPQIGLA